jgi:putative ATP-dependent endonuclease of OLD family
VLTLRDFLDEKANPIPLDNIDDLARHLIRLTPVLRLRDARFMRRIRNGTVPNMPEVEVTARELDFLARELVSRPQNLTDGQIRQGLSAMVQLLEHYFSEQGTSESRHRLMRRRSHDEQRSWRYLDIINRMIDRPGGRTHRVICWGCFQRFRPKAPSGPGRPAAAAGGRPGNAPASHHALRGLASAEFAAAPAHYDHQFR